MQRFGKMLHELRTRHLVQVALIYLGVAWGLAEATGFAIDNYDLSRKLLDVVILLLILGFPAALVLAWHHGEKGSQTATRSEIMILTTLFVLAAIGTYQISTAEETPGASVAEATDATIDLGEGSVAVLPFANNTGVDSLDWLGAGVSDLLTSNLAQIPELNVVSPQRLFDLLRSEGREETERIPDQFAMQIASRSGARIMARGSILGAADDLAIDVQLIDLEDGTVLGAERARGQDVFALADTLARKLAGLLSGTGKLARLAPPERSPLQLTGDLEAFRRYQADLRERWRSLDADDVQGRYRLAALYDMMPGRSREQRKVLEQIVEIDRSSAPAYYSLAELAVRRGDVAAADSLIERYRELVPEELEAQRLLGQLYEKAERFERARAFYRDALGGAEQTAQLLALLVRTYLREDEPGEGRNALVRFLKADDPGVRVQARLLRGDTYAWEGRFADALEAYEDAEREASAARSPTLRFAAAESMADLEGLLSSERPPVFNRSLWTLIELGRGERALDLVEAAEELHMRDASRLVPVDYHLLRYARGRALEATGYASLALGPYREILDRWGPAIAEIPLMHDLPQRVANLASPTPPR